MKLYICGNGFDLHHGLPTSYWHYKEFLRREHAEVAKEYEQFVGIFKDDRIAWSNIEEALKIDYLKMLSRYADHPYVMDKVNDRAHSDNLLDYYGIDLEYAFRGLTDFITNFTGKYLFDWLSTINISGATPDLNLSPDDLYITFNYLDTLQTLYHIPNHNVLHIHGAVKNLKNLEKATKNHKRDALSTLTPDVGRKEAQDTWELIECPEFQSMYIRSELQFGAVINTEKELRKVRKWFEGDKEYAEYVAPSINIIEDFMKKSTKRLQDNYRKLSYFVWTHDDIDTVEIMGHTLLGVDFPYYKEILVPFLDDKLWFFKAHNGNTVEIKNFLEKVHLESYRIESW